VFEDMFAMVYREGLSGVAVRRVVGDGVRVSGVDDGESFGAQAERYGRVGQKHFQGPKAV
jgi:hypothetical protein